jgi:carbon monoxide dehydrogenase subunit G
MIEISERIEVASPPGVVWNVLADPRTVVECVPGATLGDQLDDGSYDATLVVKFGPTKVTFRAKVELAFDAAAMTGQVIAKGKDKQGGTRLSATMSFGVLAQADPPGSAIPIDAQVEIFGRLASLVEGGAKFVVKHMTTEFSERLAARCGKISMGEET